MTAEQLISEGRKLQRPCFFLRPEGPGEIAAMWYERDEDQIESSAHHCWLTVDSRFVPGLPSSVNGYISIFTNEEECEGGRVEVSASWPTKEGLKLYAHPASIIPPLDAVFARGSNAIGQWLATNNWQRNWRYNNNFQDKTPVKAYNEIWFKEYPIYFQSDIYAMLGGWHFPGQDDDWYDLIDGQLIVLTVHDSEPWVEAWRTKNGEFKVIQRTT